MIEPHRFDLLFEPLKIGPVTAPNRLYQVPHCNGLGYRMPRALAVREFGNPPIEETPFEVERLGFDWRTGDRTLP